jgi:UDP-N-acetylmuramoyl-L-alanyl-D-glutamate--2,6-diaminopimelate ligase
MTDSTARPVEAAPLVAALDGARLNGSLAAATSGIAHDSRDVRPGSIFVALRGERVDGHTFVAAAVRAGAAAVVVDEAYARDHPFAADVATVVVPDTRRALSRLAGAYFGYPARALRMLGVTGTNGKTTTTHLVAAILEAAGIPAGSIGTLGARFGGAMWSLDNTTPLALELQRLLAEMRDRGARAVTMEVSSHALALDRVADVEFEVAALTNITRDHLDFHESFDAYAAAKRSLFDRARHAVLGTDDALGKRWAAEFALEGRSVTTYGLEPGADLRATNVALHANGSEFDVAGRRFSIRLPARFNVENALAALGIARAAGIDDDTSARALATFERVPGRMEHIEAGGVHVLVDYAHTPDALEVVLQAARETATGALTVVFGCGGDRDRGKRPQMGRIASELADRVFVTSDNPRGEEPSAILDDIVAGIAGGAHASVRVEVDRRAAIRQAIAGAAPGDVIVVAGKGHETYQIVGDAVQHFDDRDEVRAALAARGHEVAS